MKKFNAFFTTAFMAAAVMLASCGEDRQEEVAEQHAEKNTRTRVQWLAEIDSLENIVYTGDFDVDHPAVGELLRSYLGYTKIFVSDKEHTPEYLYKAAALTRAVDLPVKALKLYDQILTDYPDWEKSPETAFMIAFMYDDMNEKDRAREAYQRVIDKYRGDHWAVQAEERLKSLDLTDEELIRKFNQQLEAESAS
ncbi:MAG TPA: tetratricopeptide repeat protein [Cryomorphaceae bacterium]|nr:tetratricopeptide repeat protein [Cryomorphaceae bacterium]